MTHWQKRVKPYEKTQTKNRNRVMTQLQAAAAYSVTEFSPGVMQQNSLTANAEQDWDRGQSGEDACSYIEPAPEEDEQRQAGVIWASFTLRIGEDVKDTLYMPFDCFSPKPISKLRIFHLYL